MPFKAIKTLIFLPFLFPFPADCKQQKQMLLLEVGLSYLDPEDLFFFLKLCNLGYFHCTKETHSHHFKFD